jgi:hypothetical protein
LLLLQCFSGCCQIGTHQTKTPCAIAALPPDVTVGHRCLGSVERAYGQAEPFFQRIVHRLYAADQQSELGRYHRARLWRPDDQSRPGLQTRYQPRSANVGDSIMVGPGGSATVVYDDGCKVNVQPGAVTAIAPLSPCATGSNAQDSSSWGWQNIVFWGLFIGTGVFIGIEASRTGNHAASP